MSDVIDRLRAANPVPDCPPPPIEQLWRRVEIALLAHPDSRSASSSGNGTATQAPVATKPTLS